MEVGRLRHPGAPTIGSQLLDGDCSHSWKLLATQNPAMNPQVGKGNRLTTLKNKAKREGIGGTNCQDDELPLQTILQVHAQSTCKNASNKEHIEFWCMRLSKNCWLVENADATCTIKGALDSNRVVKKILRASLSYKEGSSMLFFNAENRATSFQNNPCVFQSRQFVLTALLQK